MLLVHTSRQRIVCLPIEKESTYCYDSRTHYATQSTCRNVCERNSNKQANEMYLSALLKKKSTHMLKIAIMPWLDHHESAALCLVEDSFSCHACLMYVYCLILVQYALLCLPTVYYICLCF